eukprot:736722-Amphidinium_carterae.1
MSIYPTAEEGAQLMSLDALAESLIDLLVSSTDKLESIALSGSRHWIFWVAEARPCSLVYSLPSCRFSTRSA